jgi:hypothetical protein
MNDDTKSIKACGCDETCCEDGDPDGSCCGEACCSAPAASEAPPVTA